jgi:hypothetical protein
MTSPRKAARFLSDDANVIGRMDAGQHANLHETST